MVAITVAVAAPIYVYVSNMPKPPPPVAVMLNLKYNEATGTLTIMHVGGNIITDAITSGGGGDWYLDWGYRKQIHLNGASGAGTNYQVKFVIGSSSGGDFHLEGHCNDFPNDICFTDDKVGTNVLDYWIEDASANPITVWVEVEDNLDSDQDIYVYYEKSGASSTSNGAATFPALFYDMSSDPTGDWVYTYHYSTSTARYHSLVNTFNDGSTIETGRFRYKHKLNWVNARNWASRNAMGLTDGEDSSSSKYGTLFSGDYIYWYETWNTDSGASSTQPACRLSVKNDGTGSSTSIAKVSGYSEGNSYISEQKWSSSQATLTIWDTSYDQVAVKNLYSNMPTAVDKQFFQWGPHSTCGSGAGYNFELVEGSPNYLRYKVQGDHYACTGNGVEHYFYWMFVGKYTSPEPTYSSSENEESNGGGGVPAWENLVVTVTGCSPTIEITGSEDFYPGCKIIVKYTGDIPESGDIISIVYKPANQLLKTIKI